MCEAYIQDAPDDIPQSESDVVTPEEEKSKRESPPWKLIVGLRGEKWAWRESGKRKNPRCGRRKRKASQKTHSGSLSLGYGGKSGRGEKQASGKTHDVGVGREKQAEKPTPEAYCKVAERKVGAERNWRAEKPTVWAREEKNKQENPSWKLIVRLRREKWARREIGRRKNPRRGRGKRKQAGKPVGRETGMLIMLLVYL